jgi:type IV pilus assembly protein PilW
MEFLSTSSTTTTTTAINGAQDCISTTEATADTDVFSIKRVIGIDNCLDDSADCDGSGTAVTRSDNKFYVRSNGDNGCLWHATSGSTTPDSAACPAASDSSGKDWEFVNRVYYIRNFSQTAGDGIPTLCRKSMGSASPAMSTECLAEGIEYFHIMFGLDPDDDGIANQYEGAPTASELKDAVSARIYVLVRSKDADNQYTNTKTYNLGDESRTMNDNFYRRVYTTTVPLRNLANLKLFETT